MPFAAPLLPSISLLRFLVFAVTALAIANILFNGAISRLVWLTSRGSGFTDLTRLAFARKLVSYEPGNRFVRIL